MSIAQRSQCGLEKWGGIHHHKGFIEAKDSLEQTRQKYKQTSIKNIFHIIHTMGMISEKSLALAFGFPFNLVSQ